MKKLRRWWLINKVIITGHIVKNIEIFNEKVGKFTIAVQRDFKNPDGNYDTDFLNCIVFKPTDFQTSNLLRGTKVLVDGRIQVSVYEKDQKKHYSTDIIVNRIEILSKPQNTSQNANKAPINPYQDFSEKVESDIGQQIQIEDEDLPF